MAWTTPMTFVANAILQAAQLNTHLRDNLLALKDPPTVSISSTTAYSTTSTTFVDINAALEASIVTEGGRLLVVVGINNVTPNGAFRLLLDGTPLNIIHPIINSTWGGGTTWTGVLSAGAHVIKPQWSIASGPLTMASYNILVREST